MAQFQNEKDFVNEVLLRFSEKVVAQRMANTQKSKSVATAGLLRSYRYEIRKATIQQAAMTMFSFQEHGRFLDMKRVNRKDNLIDVEAIKDWIRNIGISAFKKKPVNLRSPIGQDRILNDLAWGIAKTIKKKGKTKGKRRNMQRGFHGLVTELTAELGAGYKDRTIDQIIESFK